MTIVAETVEGVARIEIARPEKKNALTAAMYQQLADALLAAAGICEGTAAGDCGDWRTVSPDHSSTAFPPPYAMSDPASPPCRLGTPLARRSDRPVNDPKPIQGLAADGSTSTADPLRLGSANVTSAQ